MQPIDLSQAASSHELRAPYVSVEVGQRAPTLVRPQVDGKFFTAAGQRIRLQGVTYGPFRPNMDGDAFPPEAIARVDFAEMAAAGINAIRTYHVPPKWFLDLACRSQGLGLLIDIPWSKHVCFLDSGRAQREAHHAVRHAVLRGREFPNVWAYSIGNEIPTDVIRWHGVRRVERFLAELVDDARQVDADALLTYASFPPTEYLDLSFLDFVTFNIYLHDDETFRRYLLRLLNLVDPKPLVLGEIGMDTHRHGQQAQAELLQGHLTQAALSGLAGAFIFSWTDEWHTGAHDIHDWAFGITTADRTPKASYYAARETFDRPLAELLPATPRVSVVVCSFNGGETLEACLHSLAAVDYPDYEVIVVNDGSTDHTRDILARHPHVFALHQPNLGLSAARNAGLAAASGSIVAYTDSDCYVDRDWLTHLVAQLETTGAEAVGGPNLAPDDGRLAACVASAPGQAAHVLESDQVAEHIPGCNMAFRKSALESINGFDPRFRKAGDDVDVCWRLQQAGHWITFAPAALVWHHRRQTPQAYLKQQAGYGEAEALLRFKHPHRFNSRGNGVWRGVIYGPVSSGVALEGAIIYRGAFGTGLFQCIYQPAPAHWATLPSTLEWHVAAAMLLGLGAAWAPLAVVAGLMLATAVAIALLQAFQARLATRYDGLAPRLVVAALHYAQPLVRSWARYRTRYFAHRTSSLAALEKSKGAGLFGQPPDLDFWGTDRPQRTALLKAVIQRLAQRRCGTTVDSGWSDWDLEIFSNPQAVVHVHTVQEEHGSGRRLIRVRCRWRFSNLSRFVVGAGSIASLLLPLVSPAAALACAAATAAFAALISHRGADLAARIAQAFQATAEELGLSLCETGKERVPEPTAGEAVQPALKSDVA